jgi:hypothetical protein
MKKKILFAFITALVALSLSACEFGLEDDTTDDLSSVTLSGQVVETVTGNPVFNATVKITDGASQINITTGSDGKFSTSFSLTEDAELTLITFKEGYTTDTLAIFVLAGSNVSVPPIQIRQLTSGGGTSGGASSVYLFFQSAQSVGVKESGTNETAQIIFEVLDSTGAPVNSDNAVQLQFSFGSHPEGGEFLYPLSAETNSLGRATVTLNSGTIAGVAQITAEMVVNGTVVKSRPVLIAIHGGLPVDENFYVASEKLNYPLYGIIGATIDFTAFLGDRYSNPVRPGTSVYFNTSSGVIEGSAQTDNLGRATVTYLTHPFPDHPLNGPGFFEVTASTIDENNSNIQTSTVRLLSGAPQISVNPTTFDIANGSSQFFTFTVSDPNGNPLAEGTSITVSVTEGDLDVTGNIDIRLPDTQSPAYTNFSFTASDSEPGNNNLQQAIITIETSGPNGTARVDIYGTSR